MKLLSDIVVTGAERFPAREAVSDQTTSWAYGDLYANASRVAAWLRHQGVRPGDRVTIKLPNGVEFIAAHFGVLLAGAVSVPCDPAIPPAGLETICRSCTPRLGLDPPSIAQALATPGVAPLPPERTSDDVAALLYTTGTTGEPKGVILTHANTLAALHNIADFVGYTADDREVVTLPLSHSFGLGHVYSNLMCGGAVHIEPGLARVGRVLRKISEWGATGFPGTPLGFAMLLEHYGELFARTCRHLRFIVVNSAPLPPEQAARMQAALPDTDLMVYYGLTEASRSTFISLTSTGPERYASVGRPMPGVSIRLADDGEILIRGPTVTSGYWNAPDATRAALTDGWLHTGDLGQFDADGYLHVTGRLKDLINVGGYKVSPEEVERVLLRHEAIADAGAFGGDQVEAAIVARGPVDPKDLARLCYSHLEPFKVPVRFHRIDAIPRSNTGKIKRHQLAEQLKET